MFTIALLQCINLCNFEWLDDTQYSIQNSLLDIRSREIKKELIESYDSPFPNSVITTVNCDRKCTNMQLR